MAALMFYGAFAGLRDWELTPGYQPYRDWAESVMSSGDTDNWLAGQQREMRQRLQAEFDQRLKEINDRCAEFLP